MPTNNSISEFLDKIHGFFKTPTVPYSASSGVSSVSSTSSQESDFNNKINNNNDEHELSVKKEEFKGKVLQLYSLGSVVKLLSNEVSGNDILDELEKFIGYTNSTYKLLKFDYIKKTDGGFVITVFGKRSDDFGREGSPPDFFVETFIVDENFIIHAHLYTALPYHHGEIRL